MTDTPRWRPIAEAPRDQMILVYNACTGPHVTKQMHGEWPLGFWGRLGDWYPQPSQWMPLPAPPEASDA